MAARAAGICTSTGGQPKSVLPFTRCSLFARRIRCF